MPGNFLDDEFSLAVCFTALTPDVLFKVDEIDAFGFLIPSFSEFICDVLCNVVLIPSVFAVSEITFLLGHR